MAMGTPVRCSRLNMLTPVDSQVSKLQKLQKLQKPQKLQKLRKPLKLVVFYCDKSNHKVFILDAS